MNQIERLRALIKSNGWSVSEFERRIERSTGTVKGWSLRGNIPANMITISADVLGTSEAYLLGDTEDPNPLTDIPRTKQTKTPTRPESVIETFAASSDIPINELDDDAKQELEDFARFLIEKARKKK